MQKMLDEARRNWKQATFDNNQRENAEQQTKLADFRVVISGEFSAPPPVQPAYSTNSLSVL
jgi:hypothetical protein